ncbi:MAG: hypothetical protein ACRDOL_43995, partial [Streptosporangiaceae bacterium]
GSGPAPMAPAWPCRTCWHRGRGCPIPGQARGPRGSREATPQAAAARGRYQMSGTRRLCTARTAAGRIVEVNQIILPAHQWELVYEWPA